METVFEHDCPICLTNPVDVTDKCCFMSDVLPHVRSRVLGMTGFGLKTNQNIFFKGCKNTDLVFLKIPKVLYFRHLCLLNITSKAFRSVLRISHQSATRARRSFCVFSVDSSALCVVDAFPANFPVPSRLFLSICIASTLARNFLLQNGTVYTLTVITLGNV